MTLENQQLLCTNHDLVHKSEVDSFPDICMSEMKILTSHKVAN